MMTDIVQSRWKEAGVIRLVGDLPWDNKPPEQTTRTESRPNHVVVLGGKIEIVHVALTKLTSNHREIIKLHYNRDLSYKEIAAELDIPTGDVGERLAHALEMFRKMLLAWTV